MNTVKWWLQLSFSPPDSAWIQASVLDSHMCIFDNLNYELVYINAPCTLFLKLLTFFNILTHVTKMNWLMVWPLKQILQPIITTVLLQRNLWFYISVHFKIGGFFCSWVVGLCCDAKELHISALALTLPIPEASTTTMTSISYYKCLLCPCTSDLTLAFQQCCCLDLTFSSKS